MHAATFGGNPIAARAGIATIEMIESEGLLEREEDRRAVPPAARPRWQASAT
jgi:acetylornithine/succinyldiaminopimelate/putrescine aminotransferase